MPEVVIYTSASRAAVRHALLSLPQRMCAGGMIPDSTMTRCGNALLERIFSAFVVKSLGGTDEAGESWRPLHPKTIAYKRARRTPIEVRRGSRPSQALNIKQQERWWEVYRRNLAKYHDKSTAAKVAWFVLKSEGATTLLDKYGTQKTEILRDKGDLLKSLSPETRTDKSVFRVTPATVEVGTNRKGAIYHHKGVPGRLPQRRLWPAINNFPASWWHDILDEVQSGVVELTIQVVRETTN